VNPALGRLKVFRRLVTLALLVCFASSAWAEVCKGSKVPKADLTQYDAQAILTTDDQNATLQTHLKYGSPRAPACCRSGSISSGTIP
jgi:hypothetical protein